jgi:hypothetical protein
MKTLTRLLIADFTAFFDALTAHALVPIIPAWLIYAYAVPIEYAVIFGLDKAINVLRRWFKW